MKMVSPIVSGIVVLFAAPVWGQADAQRGAAVLRREQCLVCHTVQGRDRRPVSKGKLPHTDTAPDLSKREPRAYTPATLASVMWNHAPRMWPAFEAKGIATPKLSEQDSEDVFAYLYSRRYFDRPGDAGRGGKVFEEKGCAGCHSLTTQQKGPGAPVPSWKSVADPEAMVQQMWNHAAQMKNALAGKDREWVTVSAQDLLDLSAYLESLPGPGGAPRPVEGEFSLPSPAAGKPLFDARCAVCHQGTLSLENRLSNMTLTEVAADLWNHAPRMLNKPILTADEMRKIIAYVWERQYMGPAGDVMRGREAFVGKRCASCHEGPSAVAVARGERVFTPLKMVSAVWVHGPEMHRKVVAQGEKWPVLSPEEISDVVAYLNTRP